PVITTILRFPSRPSQLSISHGHRVLAPPHLREREPNPHMTPQAAPAALGLHVPTRWEIEFTCAAATALALVLVPVALYALLRPRRAPAAADGLQLVDKVSKATAASSVPPEQKFGRGDERVACSNVATVFVLAFACSALLCAPELPLSATRERRR
uniref:Uncharacterized protein n=1 Tax=Aegilops tauschii subsp. strangulata TaxID=200361 RepID=A0A453PWB7_AEGTS